VKGDDAMGILRVIILVALIAIGTAFAGCGGGGAKVETQATTTTVGQELVDLKTAYDKGIINQDEYERLRNKVMKRDR
jgi:uncharacterized membrane protein